MNEIMNLFNSITQLPQTQQDIRQLAQAQPQFQRDLQQAGAAAADYAKAQLTLQTISTISIAIIAGIAVSKCLRGR